MTPSKFAIQYHKPKSKTREHWDFRLLMPNKKVYSWAIPSMKLPTTRGERVLAVWVDDKHTEDYMRFRGRLSSGAIVKRVDYGYCKIHKVTEDRIDVELLGKHVKGYFVLIKTGNTKWLMLSSR